MNSQIAKVSVHTWFFTSHIEELKVQIGKVNRQIGKVKGQIEKVNRQTWFITSHIEEVKGQIAKVKGQIAKVSSHFKELKSQHTKVIVKSADMAEFSPSQSQSSALQSYFSHCKVTCYGGNG